MLTRALADAGVELGACDERVLDWPGRAADPGAVPSIVGWIERANECERAILLRLAEVPDRVNRC
jgi:hypothetical protein